MGQQDRVAERAHVDGCCSGEDVAKMAALEAARAVVATTVVATLGAKAEVAKAVMMAMAN